MSVKSNVVPYSDKNCFIYLKNGESFYNDQALGLNLDIHDIKAQLEEIGYYDLSRKYKPYKRIYKDDVERMEETDE